MSNIDSKKKEENVGSKISSAARKRRLRVRILSIIVGISGFILILATGLVFAGSNSLRFLLSDFGILPLPLVAIGLLIIAIGVGFIATGAGLWRFRKWAFALGIVLSLIDVVISVLARDFTSFPFIRGVIVLVALLGFRHDFS
jgi:lysylphosphatidylglycerol synthetase-like protein (DUF2156 family)